MTYSFTADQLVALKTILSNMAFSYQHRWFISQKRVRHITKTRQCGADWYFSLEALIDGIETGRDQNFLAPNVSHAMAHNRALIVHFADMIGVRIKQDRSFIELSNGATLRFLDDKMLTYAAFSGNAYVSEYAWSARPSLLFLSGRAISAHKKHRFTAYTSPSKSNEAYALWAGEKEENKQRLSADDACAQGCTLLDIPSLKDSLPSPEYELCFSAVWPQEKAQVKA